MSEESERPKPPEEPKPAEVLHADDLPQILKRNPRNFWLHPFLRWSWKRTEILYQSYSQQRVGLDESRFGIILLPFKNVIGNLMGVATTTIGVIDHWGQQLSERKKPFLEYLAGDALLRANRLAIRFQVLLIIFAIVASTFFATAAEWLKI